MTTDVLDETFTQILREGRARAERVGADHVRLWSALEDASVGGKRFRPVLVVAAHDAFGGRRSEQAARVGAAVELLHTALVIHDDVIDGDDVRRGRLNVSGRFRAAARSCGADARGAAALADAAGILVGDLALAGAIRVVATSGAPQHVLHSLLDMFDDALHTTASGELNDVRLSLGLGAGSIDESLTMAQQKTSAYSFSLPLKAGAVLADADSHTVMRCDEVGRTLGIAFQLADDLAGVFGDPALTRKSTTGDLRTNKQTPLLAHARGTELWDLIRDYVGRELTDPELAEAQRLLTASGSRGFVEDLLHRNLAAATDELRCLGLPQDLPAMITDSLSHLVNGAAA